MENVDPRIWFSFSTKKKKKKWNSPILVFHQKIKKNKKSKKKKKKTWKTWIRDSGSGFPQKKKKKNIEFSDSGFPPKNK